MDYLPLGVCNECHDLLNVCSKFFESSTRAQLCLRRSFTERQKKMSMHKSPTFSGPEEYITDSFDIDEINNKYYEQDEYQETNENLNTSKSKSQNCHKKDKKRNGYMREIGLMENEESIDRVISKFPENYMTGKYDGITFV